MRRAVVPVALLAVIAAATFVAAQSPTSSPVASGGAPRAAVLSPRRVPQVLSGAVAQGRLRRALDTFLADPALGRGRENSCLLVSKAGSPLYVKDADRALTPASTLKVLTATAALRKLGTDERYKTDVVAAGEARDGTVAGNLWLVGSGDPLLSTADYQASFPDQPRLFTDLVELANTVAAKVRVVEGGIVGDDSRYDAQRYLPTWKPGYTASGNMGALGALAVNDGYTSYRPPFAASSNPAEHAASIFRSLLKARGVNVHRPASAGAAPTTNTVIGSITSRPLREIVGEMLIHSDNETAELLVKELGRRFAGAGTTSAGNGVMRAVLAEAGIDVGVVATSDGSGLDASDKVTCGVLLVALSKSPDVVAAGLAVAGTSGTLFDQFKGNAAAGRLRAKSGALEGVIGLAGLVDAPSAGPPPLTFAFLANSLPAPSHTAGERLQERLGAALAAYPDAPPPAPLAP